MTPDAPLDWSLVVPVKLLAQAKSRLSGLAGPPRAELALAMAADTVAAAAAAPAVATVIVITDDPAVSGELAALGALILPDEPAAGLNPALAFGAEYAEAKWPGRGRAGLAGDLPALRPGELGLALAAAARHPQAFVPDAEGTGTTLYAAAPGTPFRPRFGAASRARHAAAGAVELEIPGLASLRRDVDTVDDLRRAASIGLGPRTTAVLAAAGGLSGGG
jgi:2-phospho-L-lactate/phosphoenolpyruvate guanylyltransferase